MILLVRQNPRVTRKNVLVTLPYIQDPFTKYPTRADQSVRDDLAHTGPKLSESRRDWLNEGLRVQDSAIVGSGNANDVG